ncbi:MAG: homoserine dehydrogenase [Ktedonobacterales bacterium]
MEMRIALLGCGNVGTRLIKLLAAKDEALRREHDLAITISGAFTRRAGGWTAPAGLAPAVVAASGWPEGAPGERQAPEGAQPFSGDGVSFAASCPADLLVEITTLNPADGQPALDHARAALRAGKHVATANKGPIAHGLRELRALAAARGLGLRFESTVMDGTPIINMMEFSLPVTEVISFRGLLNSTSNYVLSLMSGGMTLEDAVREAQRAGVAEADPSNDLDGWDASVKATVLANALMGADLRPQDVRRIGLGADAMRAAIAARQPDQTIKQVVEGRREAGGVIAEVKLLALPPSDTLAHLTGMETAVRLVTDTMGELTLIEGEGDPTQTAMGVLSDIVNIARAHPQAGGEESRP